MGKMLTADEVFSDLTLQYLKKAGYMMARAAAGDLLSSVIKGRLVTWRTETIRKRVATAGWLTANVSEVVDIFARKKAMESWKQANQERGDKYKQLIEKGVVTRETNYGVINIEDGKKIWALDAYGQVIRESLMLFYEADKEIDLTMPTISEYGVVTDKKTSETPVKTKFRYFTDLAPEITISTEKNIIQTTVQGRDRTRKELVSNGDITFTIKGNAVSNNLEAYPFAEVQKLIEISQYKGIIDVNNIILDQFGVKKLLIRGLHLDKAVCKNMQPYSLTCVAIEPDEVMVTSDTIELVDYAIKSSNNNDWTDVVNTVLQYTGYDFSLADLINAII